MLKCQQLLAFNIYEQQKFHAQLNEIFFITSGHDLLTPHKQYVRYTYRMVSRVFRIPFRGGVAPENGILNMSDITLYVFCIMAANQLCLF